MKKLFSILFIMSFLACTSNKGKKEVPIFNDISLKLIEGENIVGLKHQIIEDYQSYFTNSDIQIPLFKCIKNNDYTIYLGIPYNTSIEKLIKSHILDQTVGQVKLKTDSLTYSYKTQNNSPIYISEYSKVMGENLFYILAITKSKIISDSLFKQTELSNRLIQK